MFTYVKMICKSKRTWKVAFSFSENFWRVFRGTDQNFGRIFDYKVLKCILLNKSDNKNKAKCSKFGKRNGKCFLTKVLTYDIMLIQESETMRFRVLCCLEISKKQTYIKASCFDQVALEISPNTSPAATPSAVYHRYPDSGWNQYKFFILWGYDLGKESKWISRKWVQKLFLCSCPWSCSSALLLPL